MIDPTVVRPHRSTAIHGHDRQTGNAKRPKSTTIESGHDEDKRIRELTSYYGNVVPLTHIGGYPRLGRIVLDMPPPDDSDDLNVA